MNFITRFLNEVVQSNYGKFDGKNNEQKAILENDSKNIKNLPKNFSKVNFFGANKDFFLQNNKAIDTKDKTGSKNIVKKNKITNKEKLVDKKDKIIRKKKGYDKNIKINKNLINNRFSKELIGYLGNNTSLDISLKQMNELEKDLGQPEKAFIELSKIKTKKENNSEIDFKQEKYKNLKLIFLQFIIGVLLIVFTLSYVQNQTAERKFLQSSVDLWINTFEKIIGKFGGIFTESVDKNYIEKRGKMVLELVNMEKKLQICLDKVLDDKKRQDLQKLLFKIQSFREELSSTDYISLKRFIQNYDQYNLYVYSLKKTVDELKCDK